MEVGKDGTEEDLLERLVDFATRAVRVAEAIPETRAGRHIAGQLLRSGTSPAPNYAEACGAESRKDFVHKMGVCEKELREVQCWLKMTIAAGLLAEPRLTPLLSECNELIAIVVASISTAKKGMN